MEYTEVDFKADREESDILIALLGEIEYEMFEEYDEGIKAYIPSAKFSADALKTLFSENKNFESIKYVTQIIPDKNWNEEWEKNFEPVVIQNRIYVRAPFHKPMTEIEYELVIEPKLAFGTGHHATTSLMLQYLLELNIEGKTVLDMGCGSGILAVFASKRGATGILAVDIDEWSVVNTIENCDKNFVGNVNVVQGDVKVIRDQHFDVILANINRNIICNDLSDYVAALAAGGHLLLSGFMYEDENIIRSHAVRFSLKEISVKRERGWSSMHFTR